MKRRKIYLIPCAYCSKVMDSDDPHRGEKVICIDCSNKESDRVEKEILNINFKFRTEQLKSRIEKSARDLKQSLTGYINDLLIESEAKKNQS